MFFIKLFSLNENHYCFYIFLHFTAEQDSVPVPFLQVTTLVVLPPSLYPYRQTLRRTISPWPHWCHSHSWYGPGIYLKMSVSPPPVSVCARRGGDRARKTARREGAAEHCSADKWMHHWWLSQQPTPSLAYCLHQLCLRRNNMHAVNTYTHTVNMPLAWSKTLRAFFFFTDQIINVRFSYRWSWKLTGLTQFLNRFTITCIQINMTFISDCFWGAAFIAIYSK